ncbi:tetratricopeptide repeat protein [Devosia rhizoryzae]|uniref:Tetratricopeptide repeat protein n=1 Tax=Devosia rhizoryzae TaxID=2774137 RepID=A0ABX7CA87_9HYPH|nr:tetratricopeptide repeat protein [Devosia rhizoryzae]QQR38861.1 tetratricopeptide repeat protein [Devosia rhizoryzae]
MSDDKQAETGVPAPVEQSPPKEKVAGTRRLQRPAWLTLPTVESTSNSMRAVVVNLVLLAIILMAAPLIASQAARDQILLEPISVPSGLQVTGLTPEVASARLNDGLLQIIAEADSDKSSINAIPEGEQTTFDIPESGISVDALVSYARQFFNLHETVIGGEFRCGDAECSPAKVSLRLRIKGKERSVIDLPPMRRSTEAEYFRTAGLEVMRHLDPFTALAAEVDTHPSNAATIARQLIASGHEDAKWAHNVLGNVRRNAEEPEDALAEYRAALEIDPRFPPALANMASTLAENDRFEEAEPYLVRLAAADPDSPLEAEVRSVIARASGDIEAARDFLLLASDRDPLNARYKTKAAFMLLSEDRTGEALELALAAFALSPSDPLPLGFLAGYYAGQGDFVALEKLYRDAAEFAPENDAFQAQHANLLMINGNYEAALARLDQALLVNEGNVDYRLSRADALTALGRHEDALIDIDLAAQRDPSNPKVVYARARSLDSLGRKAEAIATYEQFLVMQPEGSEAELAKAFVRFAKASAAEPVAEITTPVEEAPIEE